MLVSGINVIFTYDDAKNNFSKMDSKFIRLFSDFCKKENIVEVAVNSGYRTDVKGSYHYYGWALDIYYVKYKSGKKLFFTVRDRTYSVASDDSFMNSFNSFFGKYRREYISPSNILTGYKQGHNAFRNKSWKDKNAELDKLKNPNFAYEINRNHLHHLHLAVNPDPNAKGIKMIAKTGKSILPVLIIAIVFVIKNKKAQEYLKGLIK